MTRALAFARVALYAAVALEAAFAPDIARAIALLAPVRPAAVPMLADGASGTLGWATSAAASALARSFGFAGLAFGTALLVAGTLALVEWRARRASSPAVALVAAALVAACSLDASHVGGGAVDGLFFAALSLALSTPGPIGLGAIAVVTALWCNASPAGIFAPAFAVAYALGSTIDRAEKPERTHAQIGVVLSAVATLATPALAAFPLAAWRAVGLDGNVNDLFPGSPYVVAPLGYQVGAICTIVVALAIGARSLRAGGTLVFLCAAYLAFSKGAFVPMLGIAAAPILAEACARRFAAARSHDFDDRAFATALICTVGSLALVAGAVAARTLPALAAAETAAPFGTLATLARHPSPYGRLLCTKLVWCDVAERRYGIAVEADSRIASASETTIADQRTISGAKSGWAAKARAAGVGAIFVDQRSGFATLLAADGWTSLASDRSGAIFVRDEKP